jgi:hypothetical protein
MQAASKGCIPPAKGWRLQKKKIVLIALARTLRQ